MKYYFISILTIFSLTAFAGNDSEKFQQALSWESPWRSFSNYFNYNPSATFSVPVKEVTEVRASYGYSDNDKGLSRVQDGTGTQALNLSSESFQVESKFRFYGKVNYLNDQRKNVGWRDVEDYQLLSPYLVADSIGGTYKREAYSLCGAFSVRTGNVEWGIRGAYEGGVSYRQVDPRPRNTVSVIHVNPGVTLFSENWRFGLFGEVTRYRQNVDIQVEKDDRKIFFYLLQGFGNYNRQFSILSETFTRTYKGTVLQGGFHINNIRSEGADGLLFALKSSKFDVNESDRRTPYQLKHLDVESQFTHENSLFGRSLFLKGAYVFHQTIGNETQYYPTTINTSMVVWNYLTQADRYQQRSQQADLSVMLAKKDLKVFSLWQQLNVHWSDVRENYYSPDYHQNISSINGDLALGVHCPLSKMIIDGSVKAGYKKNLSSSLFQEDDNVITRRLLLPDFAFLSSDITLYQMEMKFRFPVSKKVQANVAANGGIQQASGLKAYQTSVSIALNF